jgi:ankyrin repeat protein
MARQVGKAYFKTILSGRSERKEVQKNIRMSGHGIIGSGHGWSLIHAFAAYGRELAVQLLLEKGADIEAQCAKGTALVVAALYGYEGTVKVLLEKKANIEARNKYGNTALNVAVVNGYTGIVQLLLEKGANIEAKDNEGNTPLMAAARHERSMIIELLLARGANADARNSRSANAVELLQSRRAARAVTLENFTVHTTPTVLLLKGSMHHEPPLSRQQ